MFLDSYLAFPQHKFPWEKDQRWSGLQNTIVPKRKALSHISPRAFVHPPASPRIDILEFCLSTFAPLQKNQGLNPNHLASFNFVNITCYTTGESSNHRLSWLKPLSMNWSFSGSRTLQSREERVEGKGDEAALLRQSRSWIKPSKKI